MWADNETKDDLLGYQVHADLLRDVVLDPKMLPISIGVFGDWGSGKSSLMLLMQESIEKWRTETEEANKVEGAAKKNARVLQIMFNSWQFEDYEDTKLTLIETILSDVIKDIEDHRDVFEKADACLSKIKYLKLGVVVLKNIARKIVPAEILDLLPNKEEWKEISEDDQELLLEEVKEANSSNFIKRFREDFTQIIADGDYLSIIVYIDDLDRCSPERIIQCLEAVKLFVNVDKTAFVIGADQRIIEHAIHERYKTPLQQTTISSPYSDYLEKLIQLPYKLPKLSYSEQETYVTLLLCSMMENENLFPTIHKKYLEFREKDKHSKYGLDKIQKDNPEVSFCTTSGYLSIIPIMASFLNGNPRQLKRFLNTFDMRRRMASVAGFREIDPEILVKLMVLEYNSQLRQYIDDLYVRQKDTGFIKGMKKVEEQAVSGEVRESRWKDLWNTPDGRRWLSTPPSLAQKNLRNYFWISREALQTATPIESKVSALVQGVYDRLKINQTVKALGERIWKETSTFTKEEFSMLILLLNQELIANPEGEVVVKFVDVDKDNKIFQTVQDLKDLLEGVDIDKLGPEYADFLKKKCKDDACKAYIDSLGLSQQLRNAMK